MYSVRGLNHETPQSQPLGLRFDCSKQNNWLVVIIDFRSSVIKSPRYMIGVLKARFVTLFSIKVCFNRYTKVEILGV